MVRIESTKDKLLEGCYEWILQDPNFRKWQDDDECRLLWMSGDPGKGKTMLMISLVRELSQLTNNSSALTFFFCQSTDSGLNTATSVLRGLLWKLIHEYPSIGHYLHEDFKHAGRQLFESSNAFYTLRSILSKTLKDPTLPVVYLLIDALDECNVGRKDLLDFIAQNAADKSSKAKWLVSGRNNLDIKELLRPAGCHCMISLELNARHVAKAVNLFIDFKMDQLVERKEYHKTLQEQVKSYLTEKADSTFLWVALVCKRLEETESWNTLSELRKFPSGLQPLYKRMFHTLRFDPLGNEDLSFTIGMIRAMVLAYRPLTLEELWILAELSNTLLYNEKALVRLIALCGSFLTTREYTCYFVHQSAKEYLIEHETQRIFPYGIGEGHRQIVTRSIDIMSKTLAVDICSLKHPGAPASDAVLTRPIRSVEYSCCFWVDHLAVLVRDSAASDRKYQAFLADKGNVHRFLLKFFLNWIEALGVMTQIRSGVLALRKLEQIIDVSKS